MDESWSISALPPKAALASRYFLHAAFSFANTTCLPTDLLPLLLRRLFIKGGRGQFRYRTFDRQIYRPDRNEALACRCHR